MNPPTLATSLDAMALRLRLEHNLNEGVPTDDLSNIAKMSTILQAS